MEITEGCIRGTLFMGDQFQNVKSFVNIWHMTKLSANPFKFGDPVEGDYYVPRPELSATIKQFLENRIHVVLMGPRRFGKTSFVLNLFASLQKGGYTCLLVDIFNVTSHRDFLHQMLRALRQKRGFKEKIKSWGKHIRRLQPQLKMDVDLATGKPSLELSLSQLPEEDVKAAIQDLLEGLTHLGKKIVVAFDEFQQVSQLEDKGWLEATLRTHFQRLKNVSFLFIGSRKKLISEMLNDPARPLYRSCQIMEFPSFGPELTDWIISRFKSVGIRAEKKAIDHLRSLVQNTPNYVQMVCFHLVFRAKMTINEQDVEEVLDSVARQNVYAYQTLLNSLTLAQQRALRLAAIEQESLFQEDLLKKYEIPSRPALYASIKALKTKGILDEEGTSQGKIVFDDPLFSYWLKLNF